MWECKECSYAQNSDDSVECTGCGHLLFLPLKLVSEETGQEKTLKLKLSLGKGLLQSFAGEDAQYAEEHQFSVFPNADKEWVLEKVEKVKNPTFHNGAEPAGDTVVLKNGDTISIGSRTNDTQVMKIKVNL
jgi:hypothetical protein